MALARVSAQTTAAQPNSDGLNFAMDGDLSFGYNDSFGNQAPSTGNLNFGGAANVKGYYYDPKFLSFTASPYYSQSRLNSNFDSVFDSSGITASAQFFTGSHAPGSFSYTRTYNRESQFGLPDAGTYRTRGSGQSFGIGWGFAFPKIPSFDIGYNFGDGNSHILGTDLTGTNNYRTLSLGTGYELKGFLVSATYLNNHLNQDLPEAVGFSQVLNANTTQDTRQVNVSHRLSFNGNAHGSFNRTEYTSDYGAGPTAHETFDSVNTSVTLSPIHRLTVGANVGYTENLAASLLQSVLPTSPIGIYSTAGLSSNSLDVSEIATYSVTQHLNLQGWLDQRRQEVFGYELTSQLYSGGANYSRDFLGGTLGLYAGISRYNTSAADATQTGTTDSITYTRRVQAWTTSASFHYSRNVESALAAFTQSGYGYSVGVNRVLNGWRWSFAANGSRNALDALNTSATFAQNYSGSITGSKISFFGSYARSSGNAVQTGTGLVNSPTPVIVPSALLILYGGNSYSFGASVHPTGRLNISANYVRNTYTTQNDQLSSENRVRQAQLLADYFYRQMHFIAGYSYLYQAIGTGGMPANFQTVFVGVTRHFDFF
jgi:hypothetical protein